MRSTWMWFGLSVVCLVVGLLLVLLFTVLFIVPAAASSVVVNTQCYVEDIGRWSDNASLVGSNVSCPVIVVSYTMQDGERGRGLLFKSGPHETHDTTEKCFCQSCHFLTEDPFLGVHIGDEIKCRYSAAVPSGHPQIQSYVLLNVMLWPTIIFISGFVGVFFTCIHLAKDQCEFPVVRTPNKDFPYF